MLPHLIVNGGRGSGIHHKQLLTLLNITGAYMTPVNLTLRSL